MSGKKRLRRAVAQMRSRGAAADVLETYLQLHAGKVFGHWAWAAMSRIAAGEPEDCVMDDYDYHFVPRRHPEERDAPDSEVMGDRG